MSILFWMSYIHTRTKSQSYSMLTTHKQLFCTMHIVWIIPMDI
uniref:Uncharacterized protein n=1 Tax=Rhizophora mucronata TaxID=61149 RepID=A0A2P2P6A4_RHIMU